MNEVDPEQEEERIDASTLGVLAAGWLRDNVRERPAATLAGAFGIGYVLGRGLPDLVVRFAAAAAVRMLGEQALRHAVDMRHAEEPLPHAATS